MYQALYRKWRPKTFADVIGQDHITRTLRNEILLKRIGHAYLFIGTRGTGKTTCAKIFAKAVNCPHTNDGDACSSCEICTGIDSTTILDVIELDAASNNGVDDIRSICDAANFTPTVAKYKVYIIDEVHMLSAGAFNALLKTLEEPPPHVIFILATTEVHKVPATILSRCQKFEFHKISVDDIIARLNFIAEQENLTLEHEAALTIAKFADGAMRDALTILDKCINTDKEITYKKVSQILGITANEYIFSVIDAIVEKNSSKALSIVSQLDKNSKNLSVFFEELTFAFRNIMLIKTLHDPSNLIIASTEELERLKAFSEKFTLEEILSVLNTLQAAYEKLSKVLSVKTEVEMCLVKLTSTSEQDAVKVLTERVEKLENLLKKLQSSGAFSTKSLKEQTVATAEKVTLENETGTAQSAAALDLTALQENAVPMKNWPEVLDLLKKHSQTIATAFKDSAAYISGNYVLIDSPKEVAFELLRKSTQRDKMRLAIKEVTGVAYKLGPYKTAKKVDAKDPLDELILSARELGVNVNTN